MARALFSIAALTAFITWVAWLRPWSRGKADPILTVCDGRATLAGVKPSRSNVPEPPPRVRVSRRRTFLDGVPIRGVIAQLKADRVLFSRREDIVMCLRVRNQSGQAIRFAKVVGFSYRLPTVNYCLSLAEGCVIVEQINGFEPDLETSHGQILA